MRDRHIPNQAERADMNQALEEVAAHQTVWAKVSFVPQLTEYALNALNRQKHDRYRVNLGATWLMDHAAKVKRTIEDMKACPPMRLPVLRSGAFAGQPRIYAVMAICAIFHEGKISESAMERALLDFQACRELYMCEVEQAVRCMKWVLLDLVGKSAISLINRMQTCEGAHRSVKRICKKRDTDEQIHLATMAGRVAYAAQLQRSLAYAAPARFVRFSAISSLALRQCPMETNRADRLEVLLRQREIKNILLSLHTIGDMDDASGYLSTHPAVTILKKQGAYAELDEGGQLHIRAFVAQMARKASMPESRVAQEALRLCGGDGNKADFVSFLWKENALLCSALGVRFVNRGKRARKFAVFLQWILPAVLCAVYLFRALGNQAALLEILGGFLFGLVLLHACADQLLERILPWLLQPKSLPRLRELPEGLRAVVAIPALVETREQIDAHFMRLQVQSQAFKQALQFILICDFPQSGEKKDELGEELIQYGASCAKRLNEKNGNRFAFVARERTYNRKEGKWMGWEGLRGALMALNMALLGEGDSIAAYGAQLPIGTRYVLVLGNDAIMPSGEAQRLLCTMAHPLNDEYALMQPRLGTNAESLSKTLLARLYARPGMTAGYGIRHDRMMDLYGFGEYEGVGIYDIRRFVQAVSHLPSLSLLSYCFAEGALANCALVSDVQAVCTFPDRYSAYMEQVHRRIRGTWQLLPLALGRMRNENGERIKLLPPYRLWIADRILMTLTTLATTQFLAIATFSVLPFWFYFALAFLPYFCQMCQCLIDAASVLYAHEPTGKYVQKLFRRINRLIMDVALCPYDAGISVDAAVRALYRMAISKKKLLEWLTAQQIKRGDAYTFVGYSWHMLPALLFNFLMVLFVSINKPGFVWSVLTVAVFWCLSPLFARSLDRRPRKGPEIHAAFWKRLCKQTYEYFRAISTTATHYLPLHGVSMDIVKAKKYATPADIGTALLSSVCAKTLGLVAEKEACIQMANLLNAVDALPKWKGHLFSNISLFNPAQQPVREIRSLDSAMLALSLMVCEQALLDWGKRELSERATRLWQGMDFSALCCKNSNLFTEVCKGTNGDLTRHCHGLYASLSRVVSYVAVGCNQAEALHLANLRLLYRKSASFNKPFGGYGTLDAHLLPALFFPVHPYTFESRLMNCAVVQQSKQIRRKRRPPAAGGTGIAHTSHYAPVAGIELTTGNNQMQAEGMEAAYTAALMAAFDECKAYDTLCGMERFGMRGNFGFFDALCFDADGTLVPKMEYVTAHQGYILMAATNILTNGQITRWAARSAPVAAMLPWFECCQ